MNCAPAQGFLAFVSVSLGYSLGMTDNLKTDALLNPALCRRGRLLIRVISFSAMDMKPETARGDADLMKTMIGLPARRFVS